MNKHAPPTLYSVDAWIPSGKDMPLSVRTLAFYFDREQQANVVLETLRSEHGLGESQVEVAPLVIEGQEGTILALSIEPEIQPEVVLLAERNSGRLVADVPEEWTHPHRA